MVGAVGLTGRDDWDFDKSPVKAVQKVQAGCTDYWDAIATLSPAPSVPVASNLRNEGDWDSLTLKL